MDAAAIPEKKTGRRLATIPSRSGFGHIRHSHLAHCRVYTALALLVLFAQDMHADRMDSSFVNSALAGYIFWTIHSGRVLVMTIPVVGVNLSKSVY